MTRAVLLALLLFTIPTTEARTHKKNPEQAANAPPAGAPAELPPLTPLSPHDSATDQIARMRSGTLSPERLLALYAAQIAKYDHTLHTIIALNRQAESAAASESLAAPLYGLPLLVKDNIETADFIATTAGSTALAANLTHRDAPLVTRLRQGGAVILGKTNLSEWANFRSTRATSGWSAVAGLTRNPWDTNRSACGSSSGSAAAIAAGFAGAAIGTETDGSITCPASVNGVVGLKPTLGLISRTGVVPISPMQDTAGTLTRTVRDAALLLTVLAGSDPTDPATKTADRHSMDYVKHLNPSAVQSVRLGVMRFAEGTDPAVRVAFEKSLDTLRAAGATLVDIPTFDAQDLNEKEFQALLGEFHMAIDLYLSHTPPGVKTRDLEAVIAFDRANARTEMPYFGQDVFEQAADTSSTTDPRETRQAAYEIAATNGIDAMLAKNHLDALIAPTYGPAWSIDLIYGDRTGGGWNAGQLAAVAGYPHLSVPMALVHGLPVGLSFIGPAWSEALLLSLGAGWEAARGPWPHPPGY
ncbi:amidase [Acidomonas methanolica]|uniref:amidase n=1 Tax=Acidomonas methanolica TaxID=437 RepID=UPI00211A4F86|nr:amidase [Acidomonas methanolica]MCQ9154758.1 amidase [Acidomonas methanolica]